MVRVADRWHTTVRVAGCTPFLGEAHSRTKKNQKPNKPKHVMSIFWTPPERENTKPSKKHALHDAQKKQQNKTPNGSINNACCLTRVYTRVCFSLGEK